MREALLVVRVQPQALSDLPEDINTVRY